MAVAFSWSKGLPASNGSASCGDRVHDARERLQRCDLARSIPLAGVLLVGTLVPGLDLFAHRAGLWSLPAIGDADRWVEIHNLDAARASGIFHVEILSRRHGAPAWQVKHVAPHLAITRAALERSVVKPLKSGAVYPESFDSAYQVWLRDERAGKHPFVCGSSVDQCLKREGASP